MAEETNIPQNSVDKLSEKSEFTGVAQIGINEYKSMIPPAFDINTINTKANVSNPALRIKDGTTGSAPYHPKKVDSQNAPKFDWLETRMAKARADLAGNVDKNAYGKLYAYDSSPKGAHKARYKAYGQETYDKIGFSPEIDNETWFNANTTMYDDWKRMATQAAWPMMKLGFMAPLHSYGKLLGQADIGQDIAESRDYEEYNAIGYSTKGGVGGFFINLQNSAAYSVGILAESVVEGALIGAAVGAAGGEGVGAIPGSIIGGIAEGFGSLLKLPGTLLNMSKNLGKMTMNLKRFEKISEVRNLFGNAGRSMGNFINPISNTSEAAMKYVFKNPDDLTNLARSARTVGAMWHDVKNMNAALSEGRLEGGFTEQRVYDELYNKYYEKYGVAPSDELQKDMRKQAKVAGYQNTWKNTLLVNYSNNIAFPSIARAGFMKGLPRFSKTVGKVGPFQLVYDPAKKVATDLAYSAEKVSLRNAAKAFTKPAAYGKTALNYFKANLVEGFQETAQDVLSDATENYYINSFKNKDRQNFEYSMATLNAAMKKQISAQGLETFASGFAMGSILGIPGGVKDFMSVGYNKYFKHRNNYDEYIEKRQGEVDKIVDALNTMDKGAKNFFDPRLTNYTTQMLAGKVADDPEGTTTKEAKDTSFAAFQSAVRTSLRTGTFDMFLKNYEGYKQATPEELEQAWRLEPGQGQKALLNIDKSIASAKVMGARWQEVKNKMKHVVNPANFKDNTPEKEMAEVYNEAYLTGLDNLVFMGSAFDNNAERLNQMYGKLSSIPVIQNSRFSEIATITDPARLTKEISMLRTDIELSKNATTPEAKEQHEKQKDLLDKLTNFQKEQSGVTVDFFKRIMNAQKTIMQAESISANEAQVKALDQVTKEFEDEGLHPFESYKTSFRDLLDSLAGSEENKANLGRQLDDAGGFDNIFEILADTHILKDENMRLNKFINILNSPEDFYEHVQRNFEWMKKLYNNRQDHYDELINNSMTAIQRNTLLEELAEKGIYVDLEEFAEWCQDNSKLPTYFIDQVNKRVINKDSYIYDKYIEFFDLAKNAETNNPPRPKSSEEQKLERTIDNYNNQREGELETVKNQYDQSLKDLLGYTQEEIDEMRNKAMFDSDMTPDEAAEELKLVKKAIKQLDSDNHLEIEAVLDLATENEMFTLQEYNMAKEDLFSDENSVNEIATIAEKFTDAEDDEAMEAASNVLILKPLLEKRIEVLQSFVDGTAMEGIPNYEETQPYKDYTEAVDEINTKYDGLIDDARAEFDKAVKENVESARPEAMKKSIQEVQELFAGKEDIVQTKRNYIVDGELHDRMSNRIKTGYDTYNYTGEKALMDLYDETIGAALADGRELNQDLINEFIEALVDADLPGVNTNTFTADVVRDELETLIKTDGTKSKKIQRYISKLKSQLSDIESKLDKVKDKDRLASLQKQKVELEKAIKDEEAGKYDEPFEMISGNIKSFILNTVKENAYEESRDAGNTIDPMLKNYLDTATSVKPKWDPKKMSKEAYDSLFDDETGYLTELKRRADAGEIYIFTKDLIVHANDLIDADGKKLPPVAGEIDMIIVDRKGNKFIVDLKTGKLDKWFKYKVVGTPSYKKQLENTLQQAGYANLAADMSGMQFGIKIFPIEIGFDKKGYIATAGKPTNPSLFAGEEIIGDEGSEAYTIGLDPTNIIQVKKEGTNVYENISIEDFIQKLIPVRKVPGSKRPKITVKKEVSIPEEEREFVDDFMNKLANAGQAKPSGKTSATPIRKQVVTIEDAVGKTVYYNGKPYTVNKEGVRYVLDSESTVIELDTTVSENLSDLGIDYFEGEFYTPKYDVTINSEDLVTVDGTTYEIRVNESGNVIGLSPENKPEQVLKNEKLLIAVEIERNKTNFINTVEELEDVDYAETMDELKATDPAAHQKLELLEGVYNKNWNETVESGLSKLYSKQELNASERLAVDLWVTDAIISMTKLYSRQSDAIYAKGLDNLEIINTLLYEGYNEQSTEVSADEPAKRTVKQTEGQKQRKPGKNVTDTSVEQPVEEEIIETVSDKEYKEDTFEEILKLYEELDKAKPKLSEESYNMLKEQLDIRASLLFDETGNIVLKTGEIYIFTAPVKDEQVAQGYRVKIDSFDPMAETVTVSNVGPGNNKTFTMSIKDFNDSAMSEELINNMPKEDEPYVPSEEELGHLTESMAVTDGQLSDFEQLTKWEDEASADTISLDDLKNDFFNNFKC
ncbi:MAG: hypothetical protein NTY55_02585 [Flavobacteriia bacterium]|nr:hypothetical protein [Flavobacteriia bacterium]